MGFDDEIENRLSQVKKLLQLQTNDPHADWEIATSDGYNIQDEIDETERNIEELSRQLKANEELKQQLMNDVAEKTRKLEKLAVDLRVKEEETAKDEQNLAHLEARKLHASAGFSEKDALVKEKLAKNISAYFKLTGANFNNANEGYIVNYVTKKTKFFQVKGVPKKAATVTIWKAIESTQSMKNSISLSGWRDDLCQRSHHNEQPLNRVSHPFNEH